MSSLIMIIAFVGIPVFGLSWCMYVIMNCKHETTITVHQTYESATGFLLKKETICNRCGQLIDTEY